MEHCLVSLFKRNYWEYQLFLRMSVNVLQKCAWLGITTYFYVKWFFVKKTIKLCLYFRMESFNKSNNSTAHADNNTIAYETNNQQPDFTAFFSFGSWPITVLIQIISFLGIIANIFLLIIASKVKSKQKNYFKLMTSLATADLLLSVLQSLRPITYAYDLIYRIGFIFWCKLCSGL